MKIVRRSSDILASIFLLAILFSCKEKKLGRSNSFRDLSVSEIVSGMEKENVLMGPAVGIAGEKPAQWSRYEVLQAKASEKELIALTSHKNATVRCYAFKALLSRESSGIMQIIKGHAMDTATVYTLFGCLGGSQEVRDYFITGGKIHGSNNHK